MTTTIQAPAPAAHEPPGHRNLPPVAVVLLLTALLALVLTAFALPALKSAPHGVPIAVVGPSQAAAGIEQALAVRAPGAWAVTAYPDEAALTRGDP